MDDSHTHSPHRIAVAGTEGGAVDQHFGQAEEFLIYDLDASGAHLIERRILAAHAQGGEDRRDTIVRMLKDCRTLLVARIGQAPKDKLAGVGIEASDAWADKPIADALAALGGASAPAAEEVSEEFLPPPDLSRFRLMHAMLRVADMERSLAFYTEHLGLTVLERRDHKKNQFTQVYLGYGDRAAHDGGRMVLELVQNWNQEDGYVPGDGFGHLAIAVNGIGALCRQLAAANIPMPRPPRSQRHGENIVAFVEDPDGYRIELVQTPNNQEITP